MLFSSRYHYEVNFHWYTQMLFLCKPPQLPEILFDCIWISFLALTRIIRITLCAHLKVWPLIRQMESSKSVSSEMSAMCQRATWRCLNRNICVTGVVTIVERLSDVTVVRKAIIRCSQNSIRSVIFLSFLDSIFRPKSSICVSDVVISKADLSRRHCWFSIFASFCALISSFATSSFRPFWKKDNDKTLCNFNLMGFN